LTATTAEAAARVMAAPAGTLIVVIPAGPGSWTVVTLSERAPPHAGNAPSAGMVSSR